MVVAVVKLIHAKTLLHNREEKEEEPVFLLSPWSSHCAGSRLPLGGVHCARPGVIDIKTVEK